MAGQVMFCNQDCRKVYKFIKQGLRQEFTQSVLALPEIELLRQQLARIGWLIMALENQIFYPSQKVEIL